MFVDLEDSVIVVIIIFILFIFLFICIELVVSMYLVYFLNTFNIVVVVLAANDGEGRKSTIKFSAFHISNQFQGEQIYLSFGTYSASTISKGAVSLAANTLRLAVIVVDYFFFF